MKRIVFITILGIFFNLTLIAQQNSEIYYYYFGGKIFPEQKMDKICLKFAPNFDRRQLSILIDSDRTLQPMSDAYLKEGTLRIVILEAGEGRQISSSTIETFKAKEGIISVEYLLQPLNGSGKFSAITDEFVVKLKETTSYTQLYELAKQNHCEVGEENRLVKNKFKLYVSKTSKLNAIQMASLFYETGLFELTTPNFITLNAFNSNDSYFPDQWGLKNTGQYGGTAGIDIKAEQAWTITKGNSNVRVAIIDTGVDLTHPDLEDNLLQGYDVDNGYYPGSGAPIYNDTHGTACAGIVGALQNNIVSGNFEGISGVAPDCKIIPIRACWYNYIFDGDATDAIEWAWQNGADVISCSWGGGYPNWDLTNAINNAVTNGRIKNGISLGCVVVFAAGNNNSTISYPASLSNVIAVGAMSQCGTRKRSSSNWWELNWGVLPDPAGVSCDGETSWGSNYGNELDVVAPGVLIPTTDIQGSEGYNPDIPIHPWSGGNIISTDYTNEDYTVWFNGTSSACPHVAGVAALILSTNPTLTGQQVRNIIESTAQKIGGYNYQITAGRPNGTWHQEMGYGLINAHAAVQAACTIPFDFTGTITTPIIVTTPTTIISCGDLNVQYVTVTNGATLTLKAAGNIDIQDMVVINNSALILDAAGEVNIIRNFEVELGSEFEIK